MPYFVLSKNQILFSQSENVPCLSHHFSFITLSNTVSGQSIPVTITKFLRGHSNFENVYTPSSHLRHPNGLDLSLHALALKLIRQLGIVGVDTENIARLCFFKSFKKSVKSRFELASNARTCSAGESSRRRVVLIFLSVLLLDVSAFVDGRHAFDGVLPPSRRRSH